MALPSNAPTVLCTLSRPLMAEGSTASIHTASLQIDRDLVWAATGETIYGDPTLLAKTNDGSLTFEVIPVDAEGVLDTAGNMVTNWLYTLRLSIELPGNLLKNVTYQFQPTTEDDVFDLDLQPQSGSESSPPATVAGQEVTIIVHLEEDDIDGGGP